MSTKGFLVGVIIVSVYTAIADYGKYRRWVEATIALNTLYSDYNHNHDVTERRGEPLDSLHNIVKEVVNGGNKLDSATHASVDSMYNTIIREVHDAQATAQAIGVLAKYVRDNEPLWHRIYTDIKKYRGK